jgi:hypothetical protein
MEGDRADERWLVHRAPARARWRSPHVRRTKGSALIEVLTTARNVLGACRPLSGTTVLRQPATLRRQPQHPRSSAPRQSPPRTVYNSPAGPLEAALATAKLLAHTDPNACIPSSQPPLPKCCDDRLNPPSTSRPLGSSRTRRFTGSPAFAGDDGSARGATAAERIGIQPPATVSAAPWRRLPAPVGRRVRSRRGRRGP